MLFFDRNFDAIAKAIADGILNTLREQKEQFPLYYQVQTGAFKDRAKAMGLAKELQSAGFPVFIVYDEGLYKVRVGDFQTWKWDPHGTKCETGRLSGLSGAGSGNLLSG